MMDRFVCWGPRCPATCCHVPWQIEADEATRLRWEQLPKTDYQELVASTHTLAEGGRQRVVFRKHQDNRCIHFRDDRLCDLHARYGFENLSHTCRAYPRIELTTDWKTASAVHLSCPAAVTLLVELPADASFVEQEEMGAPVANIDAIGAALDTWMQRLLQLDQFTIAIRLVYIAQILDRIGSLAAQGMLSIERLDRILGIGTPRAENDLENIADAVEAGRLSADPTTTGKFWHFVLKATEKTFLLRQPDDPRIAAFVQRLAGMGDAEALAAGAEIHERIRDLGEGLRTKLDPYRHVLQNHLAGLFLVCGFPWRPKAGNYIAPFFRAVVSFAAAQLYLRLFTPTANAVTTSAIAEAIYQVEHSLGHHERIYHALERNPAMLRVGQYAASFASLG